jgi:hypothetical protein
MFCGEAIDAKLDLKEVKIKIAGIDIVILEEYGYVLRLDDENKTFAIKEFCATNTLPIRYIRNHSSLAMSKTQILITNNEKCYDNPIVTIAYFASKISNSAAEELVRFIRPYIKKEAQEMFQSLVATHASIFSSAPEPEVD